MIGVLQYGAGNLGSVMNALAHLGYAARFVRGPEELLSDRPPFTALIFPGDGHFATAMESLNQSGYAGAIQEWISRDRPFLGICIGLQLLFETSEEAPPVDGKEVRGLSLIPGKVKRFPGRKVPQIGWNTARTNKERGGLSLFQGLPLEGYYYFIHSYYVEPQDPSVIASWTDYYLPYCSAIERGALAAVQFHPEKSGPLGLALLDGWLRRYAQGGGRT